MSISEQQTQTDEQVADIWKSALSLTDMKSRHPVTTDNSNQSLVYASTRDQQRTYNFGIDDEPGTYTVEENKEVIGSLDLNKIEVDHVLATVVNRLAFAGQHHKRIAALLAHLALAIYADGELMFKEVADGGIPANEKDLLLATGLITGLSDISSYMFKTGGLEIPSILGWEDGKTPDKNVSEDTYRLFNVALLSHSLGAFHSAAEMMKREAFKDDKEDIASD